MVQKWMVTNLPIKNCRMHPDRQLALLTAQSTDNFIYCVQTAMYADIILLAAQKKQFAFALQVYVAN